MKKRLHSRLSAVALVALCVPELLRAETISLPFAEGFIGTVGARTNVMTDVLSFRSLGIRTANFIQEADGGQFGGTQGNDLSGMLEIVSTDGTRLIVPGAINWRIAVNGDIQYFGFIPDPTNTTEGLSFAGGEYILDETRNYILQYPRSTMLIADGTAVKGNAALKGVVEALNAYLEEIRGQMPTIHGPTNLSVPENQVAVSQMATDVPAEWEILDGEDAAFFVIGRDSGILEFRDPPDFETPRDADGDNVYRLVISAIGVNSASSTRQMDVAVEDVDEPGPAPQISVNKAVRAVSLPGAVFDCLVDPAQEGAEIFTPGTCVEYRVDVSRPAGDAGAASNLVLTDSLPLDIGIVSIHEHAGFDDVSFSDGAVIARRAELPPGGAAHFVIRAVIH